MAFTKTLKNSKLQLRLENGAGTDGAMTYKTVSYTRINEAASDEDIQAVGRALGTLQPKVVAEVLRIDEQLLADGE